MANYQGLNCIMGEIITMVSDARYPHDQHIFPNSTCGASPFCALLKNVDSLWFNRCLTKKRVDLVAVCGNRAITSLFLILIVQHGLGVYVIYVCRRCAPFITLCQYIRIINLIELLRLFWIYK